MAENSKRVLAEEDIRILACELKPIIQEANRELMKRFGVDIEDVNSMDKADKDRLYLTRQRERSESITNKFTLASVGVCAIAMVNWVMDKLTFGGL